jgi:hypothetical protein
VASTDIALREGLGIRALIEADSLGYQDLSTADTLAAFIPLD